ncbi:Y4yA family PLP-dependent enzyme [Gordonia sp. CPCC 205333]|uniref:Y4yA family PLP-dependent enzyme n=1 Tax=Gordonia sp. CPCC 205333 TaxID=3140790 RepID=UPI003AF336A1
MTLPAVERDWARAARDSSALLDVARAVGGGPFHVIHPPTFAENLNRLMAALDAENVNGTIYYGKKANKAAAWVSECARPAAGVDVASVPELVAALAGGVRGVDIGVTGAAKSDDLLWLSARHDCLIALDEYTELYRLNDIAERGDLSPRVLLRIRPPSAPASRFGFDPASVGDVVAKCVDLRVNLCGFSFHLDGYEPGPRAALAAELINRCLHARTLGHRADRISIGGGIACAYVEESDWVSFDEARTDSWFHGGRNPERTYPYFQAPTGANMVTRILRHETSGIPLAARLRDAAVALLIEPGRALVDGAGFSVFPVLGCKDSPTVGTTPAHLITTVAGLSMSMSEQWKGSEFLPDPILVTSGDTNGRADGPVYTAIGGSSCMEYDVLTWRTVPMPTRPRYGDLLIYSNTAGYQMDKNESEFHQLPLPPKIVWTGTSWHFDGGSLR